MTDERPACALCGGRRFDPLYRKFELDIVRCLACGLVSVNPCPPREHIWTRYSADYFRNEYLPALGVRGGSFDLERFDRRHAALLRLVAGRRAPPGELLEVGAGAGFFLKSAERQGWQVAGTEISSEAVRFARERLQLELRLEAAEEMSFPPERFDVAVMIEVVEHLIHPLAALRAVARVLRPGGSLILTTPNFDALSRQALGASWSILTPAEHLFYFDEETLRRMLEAAGFADVEFVRRYRGFGLLQTMNPFNVNGPRSWRMIAYCAFVAALGPFLYRRVQDQARGDSLVCLARRA